MNEEFWTLPMFDLDPPPPPTTHPMLSAPLHAFPATDPRGLLYQCWQVSQECYRCPQSGILRLHTGAISLYQCWQVSQECYWCPQWGILRLHTGVVSFLRSPEASHWCDISLPVLTSFTGMLSVPSVRNPEASHWCDISFATCMRRRLYCYGQVSWPMLSVPLTRRNRVNCEASEWCDYFVPPPPPSPLLPGALLLLFPAIKQQQQTADMHR